MCIFQGNREKMDVDATKNETNIEITGICRTVILSPWFMLEGLQFNERKHFLH